MHKASKSSRAAVPGDDSAPDRNDADLAALAKALAHPARIRIIRLLLEKRSCIGCDIVDEVGLAQSTISEHLRILKAAGIVVGEIEHPRVCYSLNQDALRPLAAMLDEVLKFRPKPLRDADRRRATA
jgi:ArsR family transcriptional regulator, arsenate/arsenite/antimonite-responsive transcriptional repressor